MINFTYSRAASVATAVDLSAKDPSSQFIAGGTNLVDLMKRGAASPERLIDLSNLSLYNIERKGNALYIGALASKRL